MELTMASSRQSMDGVTGRNISQRSNVETEQKMQQVEASGDVEQLIQIATSHMEAIAIELRELIAKLQAYDPNATAEIDRLKRAEAAAQAGDTHAVVSSLKGAARWVIDFASKVGTSLVAKILEKQMGL
jgi:hypothetical protein